MTAAMSYRRLIFRLTVVAVVSWQVTHVVPARADSLRTAPSLPDVNIEQLIARMTLEEKLAMIEGQPEPAAADRQYQAGYLPGVPRLGIPPLRLADGPPGVATRQESTGMTCTMGLAATFSVADAQRNGEVIGRDAKALGQDVVLEPYINLDRDTTWGRGFNTFGEDPLLTGMLGAAQITGIQSQGVMAQAKHFIGFEGGYNIQVDEQTLHEVYLLPFELAVDAGVASIMCGYNVVNGAQACGSSALLTQILRNELGFEGFVTSDWGANHATSYLAAGLDLEMPGSADAAGVEVPSYFAQPSLRRAVTTRTLKPARIDEAVGRILMQYRRFGLLSGASKHQITARAVGANATVVLETARHAATLLKNTDEVLPLTTQALQNLLLIGPGAAQTIATNGGGEKASGIAARQVGAYRALRARLQGRADVHLALELASDLTGVVIPTSVLSNAGKPGLMRTCRNTQQQTRDAQLAFTEKSKNALPAGTNSSWSGTLTAPEAGEYGLNIQALGATAKLIVDGRVLNVVGSGVTEAARYGVVHAGDGIAPVPSFDGLANSRIWLTLTRGPHNLRVEETADISQRPVQVRLSWVTPTQRAQQREAAVAAARAAHTAVVFVWSTGDLSLPLPDEQDRLVSDVAAVNPNTIVVLNTSQPVALPWLARVKAVLQMWYPGDEGGWATADVLLGKVNPGGHLPFTWPATLEQTVAHQAAHPERGSGGVGGHGECSAFGAHTGHNCGLTNYSEAINVGYRFFDASDQTPLFPFGFGLSYSAFDYEKLQVQREPDGALKVSFSVHNRSARAGDVVPQVYLGAPTPVPLGAQFAQRQLAGFTRLHLRADERANVTVHVPARQLQYWSVTEGWTQAGGTRSVFVAEDARHIALSQRVHLGD
jgi:beta-glucosidase